MPALDEDQIDIAVLAPRMIEAIKDDRIDEAEAIYETICASTPDADDLLVFPVVFAIQRGQVNEALQIINDLPEDKCPELKAICLNLIKDPTWHAVALSQENNPDPHVRKAMRELLGLPGEPD